MSCTFGLCRWVYHICTQDLYSIVVCSGSFHTTEYNLPNNYISAVCEFQKSFLSFPVYDMIRFLAHKRLQTLRLHYWSWNRLLRQASSQFDWRSSRSFAKKAQLIPRDRYDSFSNVICKLESCFYWSARH